MRSVKHDPQPRALQLDAFALPIVHDRDEVKHARVA
jgi:hypothetical protein